ncbi:hypothetical protein BGW41_002893 [Actinomortierella wolfii]|nr:hypothetical protein BGW41_002893 [Actinomortierella wolfii]
MATTNGTSTELEQEQGPSANTTTSTTSTTTTTTASTPQALEIPEILELILSYVFALSIRPSAMPWMTHYNGPSNLEFQQRPRYNASLSSYPHQNRHPTAPCVPGLVAGRRARLVCRRWNAIYEQMARLRVMEWTMARRRLNEWKLSPDETGTRRVRKPSLPPIPHVPFHPLQCQRLELNIFREPYGYEGTATTTIERRKVQWESLLTGLEGYHSNNRSIEEDNDDDNNSDSDNACAGGSMGMNKQNHMNVKGEEENDMAVQPWRRWTGAALRELCFQSTGGIDMYLHSILHVAHVNQSLTLLDIRFNSTIQFDIHVLLVNDDSGSGSGGGGGGVILLPNLQHLMIHGAILREPTTPQTSAQLAESTPVTVGYSNPPLVDNDDGRADAATLLDDLLPFQLKPLRPSKDHRRKDKDDDDDDDYEDDDDEEDEDRLLVKRKLRTFHLNKCDISKTYLLTLLRRLDRASLRSLSLNNLWKRYHRTVPYNIFINIPIAFFGSTDDTPLEMDDTSVTPILLQELYGERINNGVGATLVSDVHNNIRQRLRQMLADTRHLIKRFPNLDNISLHASNDRDVNPLDALLLIRSMMLHRHNNSSSKSSSCSGGGGGGGGGGGQQVISVSPGRESKLNTWHVYPGLATDRLETISLDYWMNSHHSWPSSILINAALTRLELSSALFVQSTENSPLIWLVKFLCSDLARHLKELVAPKACYPIEYLTPPLTDLEEEEEEEEEEEAGDDDDYEQGTDGAAQDQTHVVDKSRQENHQQQSSTSSSVLNLLAGCFPAVLRRRSTATTSTTKQKSSTKGKKSAKKKRTAAATTTSAVRSRLSILPSFSNSQPPYDWKCKSLERLDMSFASKFNSNWTRTRSSRAVYSFLVATLPALRHLCIRQEYAAMTISGGLCLITRLRDLEHFELHANLLQHWGACEQADRDAVLGIASKNMAPMTKKMKNGSWLTSPLPHAKSKSVFTEGRYGAIMVSHDLPWLRSEDAMVDGDKTLETDQGILLLQQQRTTMTKKKTKKPAKMSSLALSRRLALMDSHGGHFAKAPARATLWDKPASSVSSSSPATTTTTPLTHGCCWRNMKRIVLKVNHASEDELNTLREAICSARPDIEFTCQIIEESGYWSYH